MGLVEDHLDFIVISWGVVGHCVFPCFPTYKSTFNPQNGHKNHAGCLRSLRPDAGFRSRHQKGRGDSQGGSTGTLRGVLGLRDSPPQEVGRDSQESGRRRWPVRGSSADLRRNRTRRTTVQGPRPTAPDAGGRVVEVGQTDGPHCMALRSKTAGG